MVCTIHLKYYEILQLYNITITQLYYNYTIIQYYNIFDVVHLWRLAITTLDKQSCFLL